MSPIPAWVLLPPPPSASPNLRHGIMGRALSQESGDRSSSPHTQSASWPTQKTSLELFRPQFATSVRWCSCWPFSVLNTGSWTRWPTQDIPAPRVSENPRLDVWITFRNTNKNTQTSAPCDEQSMGSGAVRSPHSTIVLTCTMLFWPVTCRFNSNTCPQLWRKLRANGAIGSILICPQASKGLMTRNCREEKALLLLLVAQGHHRQGGDKRKIPHQWDVRYDPT